MFFVSDFFIENLNAQIPSFLLAILIKLLTSKFILQKAQIYYAPISRCSLLAANGKITLVPSRIWEDTTPAGR